MGCPVLEKFVRPYTYGFCIIPVIFYTLVKCLLIKLLPGMRKSIITYQIEFNFILTTDTHKLYILPRE